MKKYPKITFVSDSTPKALESKNICTKLYGNQPISNADVIVALGGDGLMLRTIHRAMGKIPIFGMNVGTVGFLMNEFDSSHLPERISKSEKISLHPLRMTVTKRDGSRRTALAMNEVSLLRSSGQMAKVQISIDKIVRLDTLFCDGVIVSTAAGSSAYNLSAHGPILPLRSGLLALTPISAFRPRHWRGAILPRQAAIEFKILENTKRPVSATADNREVKDIIHAKISEAITKQATLLFDPEHDLEERILREQFTT